MAKRAAQELSNGDPEATTRDELKIGTTTPTAIPNDDGGCLVAKKSGRSRTGSTPGTSVSGAAFGTPGGGKNPNPRSTSEPAGLEVLQLVAKGQALSSAVVVVEGVLHKMEEQAR